MVIFCSSSAEILEIARPLFNKIQSNFHILACGEMKIGCLP